MQALAGAFLLLAGNGSGALFQVVVGALAAALFIWMLSARIDVGPWACRKAPLRP